MGIYVDELFVMESKNPQAFRVGERNGHQWCHFFADSDAASMNQLHHVAAKIGMRSEWFDARDGDNGHYDLTPGKRAQAIRHGAKPVLVEEAVDIWARNRVEVKWRYFLNDNPMQVALAARRTAGVLPYTMSDRGPLVFLSFRHGTPRLRNLWGAAGGWVEPSEAIVDAAARELTEEAGLVVKPNRLWFLGFFPGRTDDQPPRFYATAQFAVEGRGREQLLQPEPHKHGPWTSFTLEEAVRLPLIPGFADVLRALERKLSR